MFAKILIAGLTASAGVASAAPLDAQILKGAPSKHIAIDSMPFVKAHNMVVNGDAEGGRAVVDSLFALTKEGTAEYAEALYWRARVSRSAESAKRDYIRIIVDYSLSPRVPNSLLNVGQIEVTSGEREKALTYFERLRRDYPGHPLQGLAGYWSAYTLFEVNDIQRACQINSEALQSVKSGNVELKNKLEFQNQRCRGVVIASQDTGAGAAGTVGRAVPVIAEAKKPVDPKQAAADAKKAAAEAKKAAEDAARNPTVSDDEEAKPAAKAGAVVYTVQLGAMGTRQKADELVARLKSEGYSARVVSEGNLHKVRVGKFTDRNDAASILADLKAKKFDGFISKE